MLRPDGAHLVVRRKFTAIRLRVGFVKRHFFLGAQLKHGLIFPGQLEEYAGKAVLHFRGRPRTVSTDLAALRRAGYDSPVMDKIIQQFATKP
jgi:hypothetical protein